MMASINLLPTNLAPKGSVVRLTEGLKNVITVGVIILLVGGFSALALFIINYLQLQSISKRSDVLKESIGVLEQTETKFVLVKDRLEKGKKILEDSGSSDHLDQFARLLPTIPAAVQVNDSVIEKDKFTITLSTLDSSALASFMSTIVADPSYKKIDMTEFSFTQTSGYLLSLSFF